MKVNKKVLSIILSTALLVAVFGPMTVSAAEGLSKDAEGYYLCETIEDYRSGETFVAPECADAEGKVFAGWYTDKECTKPLSADVKSGSAYAKFVDAALHTVKFQQGDIDGTDVTTTLSASTDLRVIAAVDSVNYSSLEFVITHENFANPVVASVDTVYNTLYKYTADGSAPITPATAFGTTDALHFAAIMLPDFDAETFFNANMDYTVNLVTTDGTPVSYSRNDVKIKDNAKVAEVKTTNAPVSDYGPRFSFGQTTPFATGDYESSKTNSNYQLKAIDGGIYYNGEPKADWTIGKWGSDSYIIHCKHLLGVNPTDGDIVTIDGQFGNDIHSAKIGPVIFELRIGDSGWIWGMYNKEITVNSMADVGSYPHNEVCLVPTETDELADGNISDHKVVWGELSIDGVQMNYNPAQYHNAVTKAGGNYYIYPVRFQGVTVAEDSKMVVDCIIGSNSYGIRVNTVLYYSVADGWKAPVEPDFTADLKSFTMITGKDNDYISGEMFFISDAVKTNITQAGMFQCVAGGLYVDGATTAKKVPIHVQTPASGYTYIWATERLDMGAAAADTMSAYGITPVDGMKIVIDGTWQDPVSKKAFAVSGLKMIFMDGEWSHYTIEEFDFVHYPYTGALDLQFSNVVWPSELGLTGDLVPSAGGIYVNGVKKNAAIVRLGAQMYYLNGPAVQALLGAELLDPNTLTLNGTTVEFKGVFHPTGRADVGVILNETFVWDATGLKWVKTSAGIQ